MPTNVLPSPADLFTHPSNAADDPSSTTPAIRVAAGEALRWYLKRARHPFKDYIVGHYWGWFCKPRIWVKYDDSMVIGVKLGDYLQQRIFFDGAYESALVGWLHRTLRPSDVFWDVGANIGSITIVGARRCRQVVAFEPDPRTLDSLTKNVRANHLGNVAIVAVALGAQSGTATLHRSSSLNSGMTSLIPLRAEPVDELAVTVACADDLVRAWPEFTPTVMKIDVEGAEHLVLAGARELLRRTPPRAIIFEDRRDPGNRPTNSVLVSCLQDSGYSIEVLGVSDVKTDDGMCNFLAIRGDL